MQLVFNSTKLTTIKVFSQRRDEEEEAIISNEWEKALSRQNQQNLRDSKDKLEENWTEVTRDKTSKVIKVGKSYNNYNLIYYYHNTGFSEDPWSERTAAGGPEKQQLVHRGSQPDAFLQGW